MQLGTLEPFEPFEHLASRVLSCHPITNTGTCKLAHLTAAFADEDRFYIGKIP